MSADKILFRHNEPHGAGEVRLLWQSGATTQYLATTGSDGTVAIFSRHGDLQERIILQGICMDMAWDGDGDVLAIATMNTSHITIWDARAHKKQLVDTGLRDHPSCLLWAISQPLLAVCTARGNLALYNHRTAKRVPILGKHARKITCGAWSTENLLALGGEDKICTISNAEGDTLRTVQIRDIPSDMKFASMKTDERQPGENCVSMILGKRTLYLYHLPEPDAPTELGFQHRYGALIQHHWFGDGYILLGFALGHIVTISTHPREVGQELWQVKNHRDSLSNIAICPALELLASCGDHTVKVHAWSNLQETSAILSCADQAALQTAQWTVDGQLLGVTTTQGAICVFVTRLAALYAVSPPRIALLTSLAEVAVYHYSTDKGRASVNPSLVTLEIEPTVLSVGPFHLAAAMNNRAWFYDLGRAPSDAPLPLGDREYMAAVKEMQLNTDYCAVRCDGQILLHAIDNSVGSVNASTLTSQEHEPKLFPDDSQNLNGAQITCMSLTNDFLCFGTDLGHVILFSLEQWNTVIQHKHNVGLKSIYSDMDGTRVIFVDDHNQGYVYIPSLDESILIPDLPKQLISILWDYSHTCCFVACNANLCSTYIFVRQSIKAKFVLKVGTETRLLSEQIPLMLCDGDLCVYSAGGSLSSVTLATHKNLPGIEIEQQLDQLLALRKYQDAWSLCKVLNQESHWMKLGEACLSDLDVTFALKVYRKLGHAAMVMALEELRFVEDSQLLSGHCAILLDTTDQAKQLLARSSRPLEALNLCRDLLQWEQAMALAGNLASDQVPNIACEYAQQLELNGNYIEALANYEHGLQSGIGSHQKLCKAGVARTSIKCGNHQYGVQIALELMDKQLLDDCADALVQINHLQEAAQLYEKCDEWDKACSLYIQLKQWQRVDIILPQVTSLRLHALHAKAKETDGKFRDAIKSYTLAGDLDAVVRIYIEHLSDPHSASELVLQSRSVDAAKMLAKFYQTIGDYESALQFLILCGCVPDAFQLAHKHNKMRHYGELLEQHDGAKANDFLQLAHHFEAEKYTLLTGKYYFLAKEYGKSLKLLLKASTFGSEESQALSLAIDCVATSNDDKLASQLIEFLLGETDGAPKDPKLLFRLYMARKQFREAAKAAVIIANQEQIAGNYRSAHDLLFSMYQELKRNNLTVATDMKFNLILLHRYILVRLHVKQGKHTMAAKLLVEVAKNISQFPSHIVPILTSTVIECQRADMKKYAFDYAVMLMRADHRSQIDPKYVKKIESIVRKAPKSIKSGSANGHSEHDEEQYEELVGNGVVKQSITEDSTPCPICNYNLLNMDITCSQCKTTLPICIATGQHITNSLPVCVCPECDFPAIKTELILIIEHTKQCPMCAEDVMVEQLRELEDVQAYVSALNT